MFLPVRGVSEAMAPVAPRFAEPVILSVEVPYLQVTPKAIMANWNLCIKTRTVSMVGSLPVKPS